MRWLVCLVVFCMLAARLTVLCKSLNSGDACKTPLGTNGLCLPVKNCSHVQTFIKRQAHLYHETQYLETFKCGDMEIPGRKRPIPLVCCSQFVNLPNCGAVKMRRRISFGQETDRGEHPWAALLFVNTNRNRTIPQCGGALISDRYVITAAHCTVDHPQWKLRFVRFNEFNTSSTENCITDDYGDEVCREDYEVESITPHPMFDMNSASTPNDISIVRLAIDVTFSDYVKPICLPFNLIAEQASGSKLLDVDEIFTVTGWGETEKERFGGVQRHVELPRVKNGVCNLVYKEVNVTLTDRQLCVGGLNESGPCRGDSGGPLMRQVDGAWYLFGVVSFGAWFCGNASLPGVYTNVVKYLDWIEDAIHL